jgi:uncharacterized OB-fold protein
MATTIQRAMPQRARCDHCGRECEIGSDWRPGKCPYCGQINFPPESRARAVATYVALVAVAILTLLAWRLLG